MGRTRLTLKIARQIDDPEYQNVWTFLNQF